MKIAHLILAHKNPAQLERLVDKLLNPNVTVFIHLDKKSILGEYSTRIKSPNVFFIKNRIKVNWAGFTQVKAIINSLREINNFDPTYDFVHLLSGQDYPIKDVNLFYEFLEKNKSRTFLEFVPDNDTWIVHAKSRIAKYHLTDYKLPFKYFMEKIINIMLPKRVLPKNLILKGRSTWFTINKECLTYVLNKIDGTPQILSLFNFSWGADELFFQTILYNSELKQSLVNNNLLYVDWSENKANPRTLTIADLNNISASTAFFARKFDPELDSSILDILDKRLLS